MSQIMDLVIANAMSASQITPVSEEPRKVQLDHIAAKVKLYDQGIREYNEMGAHILALRAEIEAEMGDAQAATVNGVEVFTHNWKNSYRTKDMQDAYGSLTSQYMVEQKKMVFDVKKFAEHHPEIARQFQTREFRRSSGLQTVR